MFATIHTAEIKHCDLLMHRIKNLNSSTSQDTNVTKKPEGKGCAQSNLSSFLSLCSQALRFRIFNGST